jgi:hypothetical protein
VRGDGAVLAVFATVLVPTVPVPTVPVPTVPVLLLGDLVRHPSRGLLSRIGT